MGRNQLYEFQLLPDKFMMCTEDIGHTLTPWNRSWELFFDGSFMDIPCETCEEGVLGYVDGFYYVEDYVEKVNYCFDLDVQPGGEYEEKF